MPRQRRETQRQEGKVDSLLRAFRRWCPGVVPVMTGEKRRKPGVTWAGSQGQEQSRVRRGKQ